MKFNNIDSFLDAIQDRMEELESASKDVTSSTDINASSEFSEEEKAKFDSVRDEAKALCEGDEILDYMCNRLADLGYSDDEITQILDYEGM